MKNKMNINGMECVLVGDYDTPDLKLTTVNGIHNRAEEIVLRELICGEDVV